MVLLLRWGFFGLLPTGGGAGDELFGGGHYVYMADLLELERCVPQEPRAIPPLMEAVVTPLRLAVWLTELRAHPDVEFARFIVRGLEQGFRVGFEYGNHTCTSAKRNMLSAVQHPQPIDRPGQSNLPLKND